MKSENVVKKKSFGFAIRIVNLYKTNYMDKKEFESMHNDASELLKIIRSIILTSKKKSIIHNS